MTDAQFIDLSFALVFFVLGIFTGAMILSDIMEFVEKRAKRGNQP